MSERRKSRRKAPASAPEPLLSEEQRQAAEAAARQTAHLENAEALPAIRRLVRPAASTKREFGALARAAWAARIDIRGTRAMRKLERRLASPSAKPRKQPSKARLRSADQMPPEPGRATKATRSGNR